MGVSLFFYRLKRSGMERERVRTFEDLDVWIFCRQLRKKVEVLVKTFPLDEKYKLIDQLVRAARSTHDNIAEGYGRYYYSECIKFCRISRGSMYEVINHMYTAFDNDYISQAMFDIFKSECYSGIRLINGYIRYIKSQKQDDKEVE
jgi:four helix bundle protein